MKFILEDLFGIPADLVVESEPKPQVRQIGRCESCTHTEPVKVILAAESQSGRGSSRRYNVCSKCWSEYKQLWLNIGFKVVEEFNEV